MKKVIILFFLFCIGSKLIAQPQDSLHTKVITDSVADLKSPPLDWWLTFGYGGSTVTDGEIGAGLGALITFKSGYNFFSARIIRDQGVRDDVYPRQLIFDAGL